MSWIAAANEMSHKISNNEVLLSDALIAALNLLGGRTPEIICRWLNREVTGYDIADLRFFSALRFELEITNRVIQGTWVPRSVSASTVPSLNGTPAVCFLQIGVQEMEVAFAETFDVKVIACGEQNAIDRAVSSSGFRERTFLIEDTRISDFFYQFTGAEMLSVYDKIRRSLVAMLPLAVSSLSGKGLIMP